jgi:hypothetical protein
VRALLRQADEGATLPRGEASRPGAIQEPAILSKLALARVGRARQWESKAEAQAMLDSILRNGTVS